MASVSETARKALAEALAPAFASFGYVGFSRNVAALTDMRRLPGGAEMFATLRDAEIEVEAELLGSDRAYELIIRTDVEIVVADADQARRDAAFDDALEAVDDALALDRTLGGAASDAEIERIDPVPLTVEGAEGLKAAAVTIRMLATSSRPF